ncbi:MAG: Rossmann fold nucleotide-binding protein [Thermodesulfobacteriota bacterium]
MHKAPLLTHDGQLLVDPQARPTIDEELGVPMLRATMRLEQTSDTLRGVLADFQRTGLVRERCCLIGRSGHSQIGLDVDFGDGEPVIDTLHRRVDIPIQLRSLNRAIPDVLFAELQNIAESSRPLTIGRMFIPMGPPLSRAGIEALIERSHLLLPEEAAVDPDGIVTVPLEPMRYLLSTTLLRAGRNIQLSLYQSKEGLGLVQYPSHEGLPAVLEPGDFLVGAVRISLGTCCAVIDRLLNEPGVFHLAARLLDAVRTTGIGVPRQVELYNGGDRPQAPETLRIRLRLFPAEPHTARVAEQVLAAGRAAKIIREGVDFADATGIFDMGVCGPLFDNLSSSCDRRGHFARMLSPDKCIEIPRETLDGEWHENAQSRVIYEVVRGTITSGVREADQVTPDLRTFVDRLGLVGGAQNLRRVFVSHEFPATDTLRVLKRNHMGVFIGRSVRLDDGPAETCSGNCSRRNIYFGQSTFETFCDLAAREGVRFYMLFGEGGESHVREFYRGFWVTRQGKERLAETHTMVAMFGSHVEGTEDVLTGQIRGFLHEMRDLPEIGGRMAVCHGSGPGVMRIADMAAADLGLLRIGVGIDSERIGQMPNLEPPVLVNFKNNARHMRQNLLDRSSLFKIYNIGGLGTFEEMLIAITNLKLFESLPAPHIFVDPFGLGENGAHLWQLTLEQLRTATRAKTIGSRSVLLAPAWVPNFCHLVSDYRAALQIIADFCRDPLSYWRSAGIPKDALLQAIANAVETGAAVPPYVEAAASRL